jgi:hypothetical protein
MHHRSGQAENMNSYYGRNATPDDDGQDPALVATVDQSHAMLRDFAAHLVSHCHDAVVQGFPTQAVALQMAAELNESDHTRETFSCLLGVVLVELAVQRSRH